MVVWGFFELLGGVAVFLSGLKIIAASFSSLTDGKLKKPLQKVSKNKYLGVILGTGVTALTQSSVAVNTLAVALVESGALSLSGACAVIIGTNVGTTVTAHLVSAAFNGGLNVPAIGAFIAFIGFLLEGNKNEKINVIGRAFLGFGFVFIGVKTMSIAMESFYDESWFKNLFLIKSPAISLLNGFFITALCQSSSVVSGTLVILATNKIVSVENAIYMIAGANIGSTVAVIFAADKLCVNAKRAAYFNLLFNLISAAIFFVISLVLGKRISSFLVKISSGEGGAVANFHTFFNLIFGVLAIPFLEKLSDLLVKIFPENFVKTKKTIKSSAKKV